MAEMTIRRVGVLSLARIQGLLMLVIGLIIGVIYGLIYNALAGVVAVLRSISSIAVEDISFNRKIH